MAGRSSAATEAARVEYMEAKVKPSARVLAEKHGLSTSTVHRCAWFIPFKYRKLDGESKD